MSVKTKIIIAGIGGVGGYFGGLLARQFHNSGEVDICFLARGEHLQQIKTNGLKVVEDSNEFIVKPALATDSASEIGIADTIILCTKNYDLESAIEQLKPCIGKDTLILPLLNGVDSAERIKNCLPNTMVAEGCAYIVSHLREPGVIENSGKVRKIYFGIDNTSNTQLEMLEKLFLQAGVDATLSDKISVIIWEKYIFIAPTATATSYYNNSIGELMADEAKTQMVLSMIEEVAAIATAKNIPTDKDIIPNTLKRLRSLPYETSSSMHRDYKNHKAHTELESLAGYVIKEGRRLNIKTPAFEMAYKGLLNNPS